MRADSSVSGDQILGAAVESFVSAFGRLVQATLTSLSAEGRAPSRTPARAQSVTPADGEAYGPPSRSELLTLAQAAAYLNVTAETAKFWTYRTCSLPRYSIGGKHGTRGVLRFKKADLDAFIERGRIPAFTEVRSTARLHAVRPAHIERVPAGPRGVARRQGRPQARLRGRVEVAEG
jgi:helix-turn-helix protein